MLDCPVAIIIFNRPAFTRRLIDNLRVVRPRSLYVIADGPRGPQDEAACAETRAVIDTIDWECDVHRHYAETNLGCGVRPQTGIGWLFEQTEAAIILEDDCLPDPSFYEYCRVLLDRFATDERIMCISGNNFQFNRLRSHFSYFYSRFPHTWGWATWRRAWALCDPSMALWPGLRQGGWLFDFLSDPHEARHWTNMFNLVHGGQRPDIWDYQWTYSCWINNGLTIQPKHNLVSNIGFGSEATHTTMQSPLANLPAQPMEFPLSHPPAMIRSVAADSFYARRMLQVSGVHV